MIIDFVWIGFWALSDQGPSSSNVVMLRLTKPQSQSCTGFTQSNKSNTNTALMMIATPTHPFKMLAIKYCSSCASNQATKPKLHEMHSIPQIKHQHPTDVNCKVLRSFKMLAILQNWCSFEEDDPTLCVLLPMTEWSGSEFVYRRTIEPLHLTKPQSQCCAGFTQSNKTITNTALMMIATPHTLSKWLLSSFVVVVNPTKPQSPSCMGCIQSHKSNTNITLMWIVTPSHPFKMLAILQNWCSFWGRWSPLCVWLLITKWSGSEFMYHSNAASNQATKPKLHRDHTIQQNQHQHCTDDDCNPLTPFQNTCYPVL